MKTWHKPQLIVLVRSKPEEAILTICKAITFGTDPHDVWMGCGVTFGGGCTGCEAPSSS